MNACALCHRPLTDPAGKRRGPAGKNYTGQPHPSATKLAEEFSGRFLSQMPYPGGIILQRSILAWLMRHDIPLDEIRTYGVLA